MSKQILNFIFLYIILLLAQVLICNNVCLFNIATPFVFLFFIIRLPIHISANWMMTICFFAGLLIDIFSDTQGMNALACLVMGASRGKILDLYVPRRDEITNPVPSMKSLGIGVYLKYMLTMVLLFCLIITFVEAFTLKNFWLSMLRALGSTLFTFVLLLGIDSLVNTKNEKRL